MPVLPLYRNKSIDLPCEESVPVGQGVVIRIERFPIETPLGARLGVPKPSSNLVTRLPVTFGPKIVKTQ